VFGSVPVGISLQKSWKGVRPGRRDPMNNIHDVGRMGPVGNAQLPLARNGLQERLGRRGVEENFYLIILSDVIGVPSSNQSGLSLESLGQSVEPFGRKERDNTTLLDLNLLPLQD
jgi:hypothetical protein